MRTFGRYAGIGREATLVLLICGTARATIEWDANGGTGGDWHEPLNWTSPDGDPDNTVPTAANAARLTSACSAANPVTIATDAAVAASLIVGSRIGATSHKGYLDIETNLTMAGTFTLHQKGQGFVNHRAGTLTCRVFSLAESTTSGDGTGTYELTGSARVHVTDYLIAAGGTGTTITQNGEATVFQIDGNVTAGDTSPGLPWRYNLVSGNLNIGGTVGRKYGAYLFDQSGGTAVIGGALNMGTGYRSPGAHGLPYEWIISGNSSLSVGGSVQLGCTDVDRTVTAWGRFTLKGSRAEGSDVVVGGNWRQTGTNTTRVVGTRGVVKAVIDAAALADPATMRKIVVSTGKVTFDDGSMVQPEFDPAVTPAGGTWTLMTWPEGNVADNGLVLEETADPTTWSFAVTPTSLTVTYTPPAPLCTLILLQ